MKKVFSILLLVVFSFNILGVIAYYSFQRHLIKKEVKAQIKNGIPDEDLVEIILSESLLPELIWYKKHEFKYQSQMHDIVRTKINESGQILLYCLIDEAENELNQRFEELVDNTMNQHDKKNSSTKSGFKTLYFLINQEFTSLVEPIQYEHFFAYTITYQAPSLKGAFQPPRTV